MKVVILLLTFISVVQQGALAGNEKQIKTDVRQWVTIGRSFFDAPTLSHDGNTVFIYSSLPLQDMEVTVTDSSGYVVYNGTLSVEEDQTVSFTFDDTGDETYIIEVSHVGKYLSGSFELSE
jgi:hypothetical protein